MASTLPIIDPCCTTSCTTTTSVEIPGPQGEQGPAGADGAPGTNGLNAYTTLAANFTMPAEQAADIAAVVSTGWMVAGQIIVIQGMGYLRVTAILSSTTVALFNVEDTATNAYLINVAPGTIGNSGNRVGPAGEQGPAGTYAQIYQDRAPGAPPDNLALPAISYPTGGGQVMQWDVASQLWV